MTTEIIISKTGEIHGKGCDKFKWVARLTDEEREAVRGGEIVLVKTPWKHHTATEYKRVFYRWGKYYHRNYYGA